MKAKILTLSIILVTGFTAADTPDNITLEIEFNPNSAIYMDGSSVNTEGSESLFSPISYPYIVSEQPVGIVGLSGVEKITYTNDTPEKFSVTQTGSEFLVPFTQGGYQTVEAEEDDILGGTFLQGLEPSFSFFQPESPVVRASYLFEYSISNYTGSEDGIDTITVRNKLNGMNKTELTIQAE